MTLNPHKVQLAGGPTFRCPTATNLFAGQTNSFPYIDNLHANVDPQELRRFLAAHTVRLCRMINRTGPLLIKGPIFSLTLIISWLILILVKVVSSSFSFSIYFLWLLHKHGYYFLLVVVSKINSSLLNSHSDVGVTYCEFLCEFKASST